MLCRRRPQTSKAVSQSGTSPLPLSHQRHASLLGVLARSPAWQPLFPPTCWLGQPQHLGLAPCTGGASCPLMWASPGGRRPRTATWGLQLAVVVRLPYLTATCAHPNPLLAASLWRLCSDWWKACQAAFPAGTWRSRLALGRWTLRGPYVATAVRSSRLLVRQQAKPPRLRRCDAGSCRAGG